jgi:hypothetical protein
MAETPSEILVGANGSIHVAPLTATLPDDPTEDYTTDWTELGLATPAGVKLHDGKTIVPIKSWQKLRPTRRIITDMDFTASFVLQQWNADTVPLAFGGGEITSPSAGVFRYDPPEAGRLDERAFGIDWEDGDRNYRLIIPQGIVQNAVDSELTRAKESELPIVVGVTIGDEDIPYFLLTDDPAFSPT